MSLMKTSFVGVFLEFQRYETRAGGLIKNSFQCDICVQHTCVRLNVWSCVHNLVFTADR